MSVDANIKPRFLFVSQRNCTSMAKVVPLIPRHASGLNPPTIVLQDMEEEEEPGDITEGVR